RAFVPMPSRCCSRARGGRRRGEQASRPDQTATRSSPNRQSSASGVTGEKSRWCWESGRLKAVGRLATGLRISEKIRRSQGDMLAGEPCTMRSPKMRPVPAAALAEREAAAPAAGGDGGEAGGTGTGPVRSPDEPQRAVELGDVVEEDVQVEWQRPGNSVLAVVGREIVV